MLTEAKISKAAAGPKAYKLSDTAGLYLHVSATGAKSWRYDYRAAGRRYTLTLGQYPLVSLKEARQRHTKARATVQDGGNPAGDKRRAKREAKAAALNSFRAVADDWLRVKGAQRSESWRKRYGRWLTAEVYPVFGDRPIKDIEPDDVLEVMRRFEARGALTSAELARSMLSSIFRHAIRNLRAKADPAHAVMGAITVPKQRHHPTMKPAQLPDFFAKLDEYAGLPTTKHGLRLLLLTFARKTELSAATWGEIDLDAAEWRIPPERMKMGEPHIVPLSRQALALFRELQVFAGTSPYVFPNRNDHRAHMGPSRFNDAIAAIGYTGIFSPHGARSLASTVLNEQGWRPDVIERQLAHSERNKIRAAYNRAEYLQERRQMMQAWADMLDEFAKPDSNVRPLRRPA